MEVDQAFYRDNVPAARRLRQRETSTEIILWGYLRNRRFHGLRFRRQHPVRNFVVDFYCPELKLAVEIDGLVHAAPEQQMSDANRQAIIEEFGIRFVRVSTESIAGDVHGTLRYISAELKRLGLTPAQ
jgi:very-short-patch-repair endonuclease